MLEEGIRDNRHKRMTVRALPGSSLEVIETEFFFQLLVSLLANPSRLDVGRRGAQVRLRRQVGEIVFLLSGPPVFADEPGLLPGQMLLAATFWAGFVVVYRAKERPMSARRICLTIRWAPREASWAAIYRRVRQDF